MYITVGPAKMELLKFVPVNYSNPKVYLHVLYSNLWQKESLFCFIFALHHYI